MTVDSLAARVARDPGFAARFTLQGELGRGGMGEVHRAVQKPLDRPVAIKFLAPAYFNDPEFQRRFLAEAKLAAGLVHTHVVAVFDFGVAAGVPYIVSELVEGVSLEALRIEGRAGRADAVELGVQLLDGLAAIHERGVIHRDVKPANLLVREAPRQLKIADFGIARQTTGESAGQTTPGMVVGTPRYMSPEQAAGDRPGPASDLYMAGIVLYELFVGVHPFEGSTLLEMMKKHIHEPVDLPAHLPKRVAAFLGRALAKAPGERFASAQEMREALAACAGDSAGTARPLTPADRAVMETPTVPAVPPPSPTPPPERRAVPRPRKTQPAKALPEPARPPYKLAAGAAVVAVLALGFALRGPAPVVPPRPSPVESPAPEPPPEEAPETPPGPGTFGRPPEDVTITEVWSDRRVLAFLEPRLEPRPRPTSPIKKTDKVGQMLHAAAIALAQDPPDLAVAHAKFDEAAHLTRDQFGAMGAIPFFAHLTAGAPPPGMNLRELAQKVFLKRTDRGTGRLAESGFPATAKVVEQLLDRAAPR